MPALIDFIPEDSEEYLKVRNSLRRAAKRDYVPPEQMLSKDELELQGAEKPQPKETCPHCNQRFLSRSIHLHIERAHGPEYREAYMRQRRGEPELEPEPEPVRVLGDEDDLIPGIDFGLNPEA